MALTDAFISDLTQAQTAAKATKAELWADIPNDTNIQPDSYFSQVVEHEVRTNQSD